MYYNNLSPLKFIVNNFKLFLFFITATYVIFFQIQIFQFKTVESLPACIDLSLVGIYSLHILQALTPGLWGYTTHSWSGQGPKMERYLGSDHS